MSRADLAAMHDAGNELLDWQRILAKTGDSIIGQVLGREVPSEPADWSHYPVGDIYDVVTHAQYFYHRHAAAARDRIGAREHGHFHTFMRPRGMPPGTRPLVMPELAIADAPSQPIDPVSPPAPQPNQGDGNDKFSHIVAISLDGAGQPTRLFTTNRWVTGETWYAAEDVIAMLDRFSIELARPSWPLNRWLCALLRLYRGDIAELLRERDVEIMSWRRRRRGKVHVFEDGRLEIPSSLDIDPADRLRRVARALDRAA
ncbi:MAG TPA: hypothetical protein VIJ42_17195 [Stellaceae bacterium]